MSQVVDNFVEITRQVIAEDGLEGYLPTLMLPAKREVLVLEGAPQDSTLPTVAKRWAEKEAGKKADYVLAFRSGDQHFCVVARIKGATSERREKVHDA